MLILMRRFANSVAVMKCFGAMMRLSQLHEMKSGCRREDAEKGRTSAEMLYLASLNFPTPLPSSSSCFHSFLLPMSSFPNVNPKDFALICCLLQKDFKTTQALRS
jgi:hypothetical protein